MQILHTYMIYWFCPSGFCTQMVILNDFVAGNSASGYNLGNVKSNIMKKAKLDLMKRYTSKMHNHKAYL